MQTPTVGRIVHYLSEQGHPLAAIVCHVWSDTCLNLAVFDQNGVAENRTSVLMGDKPGDWAWPPRVS